MNNQTKRKGGNVVSEGIGWCDATWNPISGCQHGCRWMMPDGAYTHCYAETVAQKVAAVAYPDGFEHHYWHPERLDEPLRVKEPKRIFIDSMSDLMGAWVPSEQIVQIMEVIQKANWHTFQLLTKNSPRLLMFEDRLPKNLWVLVSSPPDFFKGKMLTIKQKNAMLEKQLQVLMQMTDNVTGISIEPLSWDISPILRDYGDAIDWAIIGAASQGRIFHQPDPEIVNRVLDVLDANEIPVYMKGNLEWDQRRKEFPS